MVTMALQWSAGGQTHGKHHVSSGPKVLRSNEGFWKASVLIFLLAGPAAAQTPPAPSVVVAPVAVQDVTDRVNFVGNIEAMQQVDLRARVEGFLESIAFSEGAFVQKDAPLYQIERAPYTAT